MKIKHTLIVSLLMVSLSFATQLAAKEKTVNELSAELSTAMQQSDFTKSMELGEQLVDLLLVKKDLTNAMKLASKFADATSPAIARFGDFQVSKVFHKAYELTGNKELLVSAGAALFNASNSKEADLLLVMYAKKYAQSNPEEYLDKVAKQAKEMSRDKSLQDAYNHINYDRFSIVENYLESKVISVNDALSSDGTTLLHMAVWYEKKEVVERLINTHQANVNARDKEGDSPLKYAKHKQNQEIIALLESKGATL